MMEQPDTSFQSLLHELRVIQPPEEFASKAHIRSLEEYEALYLRSVENPEEIWGLPLTSFIGSSPGRRCWNGMNRGPSGSSAAR